MKINPRMDMYAYVYVMCIHVYVYVYVVSVYMNVWKRICGY